MKRCIQLAKTGRALAAPNPSVGCVIVSHDQIIGEGVTSPYGGAHAEINAIKSIKDKSLLDGATLYVTLEPCCHQGKTPPCTDEIIQNGITRVIVGCLDPNPKVSGQGIAKLKTSGISITTGVCESKCREVHKEFLTFQTKARPYIILKWAESSDGIMAPLEKNNASPYWISNTYSQQLSHKLRTENQAILVGANTVKADHPQLTARQWHGKQPKRYVLSAKGDDTNLLDNFDDLSSIDLIGPEQIDFSQNIAQQVCDYLVKHSVNSLIVEGGEQTLNTFIKAGLWDEAMVFISDQPLLDGLKSPKLCTIVTSKRAILNDTLMMYHNN